jgi:hypothetical protein
VRRQCAVPTAFLCNQERPSIPSLSTVVTVNDRRKGCLVVTHESSKCESKDLSEFNDSDKTAHLRWGLRRGLQTRLSKVFIVAQKREVGIKADRCQASELDTVKRSYSSSCIAHGLPRSVLKERSNTIRTLGGISQLWSQMIAESHSPKCSFPQLVFQGLFS